MHCWHSFPKNYCTPKLSISEQFLIMWSVCCLIHFQRLPDWLVHLLQCPNQLQFFPALCSQSMRDGWWFLDPVWGIIQSPFSISSGPPTPGVSTMVHITSCLVPVSRCQPKPQSLPLLTNNNRVTSSSPIWSPLWVSTIALVTQDIQLGPLSRCPPQL